MRLLFVFIMISSLFLIVGCSTVKDTTYLTPIPIETLSAYSGGKPIQHKLDAVIVGQRMLWGSRTSNIGELKVVFVDKITLTDALKKIGWTGRNWTKLSDNTKVWLVIFEGDWQLIFPVPGVEGEVVPTLEPPYHGCEYSLFTASDGSPLAGGSIPCPSDK
ncbi:MAG: hypothetical protein HND47_15595 [Chloroflexi bacterium]|nr:hypothetical protein [Chloroflexota bacterium]